MKLTARMTAFVMCAIAMAGPALAGTFDLKLTVDVPPAVEPTAKNVKIAPLPAGKKLAVVLYVDWSYRSAPTALPLARSFSKAVVTLALSNDHNAYSSTMRDEFRIYNRPLSVEEIQEHIKQVKAKAKKTD